MREIRTKRLLLRPFRETDIADFFAIYGDPEAMKYWSTLPHRSQAETAELVRGTMRANPDEHAEFAIEFEGRVIGKAGFWNAPEIGFILHPSYWRKGFAQEAVRGLIGYGFDQLGLDRITADVDPDNTASLRLLTKLGFVESGRAERTIQIGGKWFDSVYLTLERDQSKKARQET